MQAKITSWDDVPIIFDLPYASRLLGKSYENLKKLSQTGKFPAFKCGNEWRVEKSDIQKYIDDSKVEQPTR